MQRWGSPACAALRRKSSSRLARFHERGLDCRHATNAPPSSSRKDARYTDWTTSLSPTGAARIAFATCRTFPRAEDSTSAAHPLSPNHMAHQGI
eukprot:scaffold367_cov254-Pinguiococcus_pyrenoidosus.AAC.18